MTDPVELQNEESVDSSSCFEQAAATTTTTSNSILNQHHESSHQQRISSPQAALQQLKSSPSIYILKSSATSNNKPSEQKRSGVYSIVANARKCSGNPSTDAAESEYLVKNFRPFSNCASGHSNQKSYSKEAADSSIIQQQPTKSGNNMTSRFYRHLSNYVSDLTTNMTSSKLGPYVSEKTAAATRYANSTDRYHNNNGSSYRSNSNRQQTAAAAVAPIFSLYSRPNAFDPGVMAASERETDACSQFSEPSQRHNLVGDHSNKSFHHHKTTSVKSYCGSPNLVNDVNCPYFSSFSKSNANSLNLCGLEARTGSVASGQYDDENDLNDLNGEFFFFASINSTYIINEEAISDFLFYFLEFIE